MRPALWAVYLVPLLASPALALGHGATFGQRSALRLVAEPEPVEQIVDDSETAGKEVADAVPAPPGLEGQEKAQEDGDAKLMPAQPSGGKMTDEPQTSGIDSQKVMEERNIRPHKGEGPETVEFGVFCKSISNIGLKRGTFSIDAVTTLRWVDARAAQWVPDGFDSLEMSRERAALFVWMPDIVITNRDTNSIDTISSTVIINKTGVVAEITRQLATVRNRYAISAFPFDSQTLAVRLGSSSLMLNDMQLVPMVEPGLNDLSEGIFNGSDFYFESVSARVFEETDSWLSKSRGELQIFIHRASGPYLQSILLPELLVLVISFCVNWLPLLAPFAMPRVGMALIAFLSLMTLSLRTTEMLPTRGGMTWIDLFETSCQTLMFFSVILNVFVLVTYHQFGQHGLANRMDHELKVLFPLMACVHFGVCFWRTDGTMLAEMATVNNSILFLGSLSYMGYCMWRLLKLITGEDEEEEPPTPTSPSAGAKV